MSNSIDTNVPIVFMPYPVKNSRALASGSKNSVVQSPLKKIPSVKKTTLLVQEAAKKKKIAQRKNKKELKKGNQKKQQVAKKIEKPKKEEPKKIEPVIAEKNESIISKTDQTKDDAVNQEAVLYVNQEQLDALQKEEYIKQAIANIWSPPSGLGEDLACIIKLIIDQDGIIAKSEIDTSSGVLAFDTSARMALASFKPLPWMFNKELFITFKQ